MTFDNDAPLLCVLIDPGDEVATLRRMPVNEPGFLGAVIGGALEAVELDGGAVMWLDESGKHRQLATNLLATQIAHRLGAGLYPDDTINGRAIIVGESNGPSGDLICADVPAETLIALRDHHIATAAS